jgi:hypothetical protein
VHLVDLGVGFVYELQDTYHPDAAGQITVTNAFDLLVNQFDWLFNGSLFDQTKYESVVAPACWSRGNAPDTKTTGDMPSTNNAVWTFESYNPAEGFIKSIKAIENYSHFGYLQTQKQIIFSNASNLILAWRGIYRTGAAANQFFFQAYDDVHAGYLLAYADNVANTLNFQISGGAGAYSNIVLQNNKEYLIVFAKIGTAPKIFINGNESTYSLNVAYSAGAVSITRLMVALDTPLGLGNICKTYWAGYGSNAYDSTIAAIDYGAGKFLGNRYGYGKNNIFYLLDNKIQNRHINRSITVPLNNYIGNGDNTGTLKIEISLNGGTFFTLIDNLSFTYDGYIDEWICNTFRNGAWCPNYLTTFAAINTALNVIVAVGDLLSFRVTDLQQPGFVPVVLDPVQVVKKSVAGGGGLSCSLALMV